MIHYLNYHVLARKMSTLSEYESPKRVPRDVAVNRKTEPLFALFSARIDWCKGDLRYI